MNRHYSFLLEFKIPGEVSQALLNATDGNLDKAQELLAAIIKADPHAFEDLAANTGKGSVVREMIRNAATQARIAGDIPLAQNLEREAENIASTTSDLVRRTEKGSRKALANMEKASVDALPKGTETSEAIKAGIDKAEGKIAKGRAKVRALQDELMTGATKAEEAGRAASERATEALGKVSLGVNTPAEYEKLIQNLERKKSALTNPVEIQKYQRQIDYLKSKAKLNVGVGRVSGATQVAQRLRGSTYGKTGEAVARTSEAIGKNLTNADTVRQIVQAGERTPGISRNPSVIRTIKGWVPKIKRFFHIG